MTAPSSGVPGGGDGRQPLTGRQLFLLAFAAAVVTANAYYIHPIIALAAGLSALLVTLSFVALRLDPARRNKA
jgi:hypothetical protein